MNTPSPEEVEYTIFGPDDYFDLSREPADIEADDALIDVLGFFMLRNEGASTPTEKFWWL